MKIFEGEQTKIIATIGPASSSPKIIGEMIKAGADGFRLNFSHGDFKLFEEHVHLVRGIAEKLKKDVAILGDLQGPKIRVGKLKNGVIQLKPKSIIKIYDKDIIGDENGFSTSYKNFSKEIEVGEKILIDDGLIKLKAIDKSKNAVQCEVIEGGLLKERKGVNIPDTYLKTSAITEKDKEWIDFSVKNSLDFLALSFVRNDEDIFDLKSYLKKQNSNIPVIAKIELKQGVKNFESILKISEGLMVARGDLGVELGPEEVPPIQKYIIKRCIEARKLVITATQLLDSMINNPIPTRAEASDVANVVLDGTDAVLLTAETSIGKNPVRVIQTMSRLIQRAEKIEYTHNVDYDYIETDEAHVQSIALASCQIADDLKVKAIVPITYSGFTAIVLAKYFPKEPILAVTNSTSTRKILKFYRGIETIILDDLTDFEKVIEMTINFLRKEKFVKKNDLLLFVGSLKTKQKSISNLIKVVPV
ncbi:MAG: pyruvate kinase [Ignavibacteria bacterium]|nr:pyruvate kinase [Ignavibacteria bacterium]